MGWANSIEDLQVLFRSGKATPVDIVKDTLQRIVALEPSLNCILKVTEEEALQQAHVATERLRGSGPTPTPLTGIPVLLKDNISTAGVETTAGSRILQNYVPPYDATVVTRLRAAGAVFVGKANMDEFAMGSSNENSAFGVVHNPWALEYAPGGSSGGCAAGVAADECTVAFGSDTGGSIRQPAALCGVTAIKPTYGLVSRYGLLAFASSLDQIGPLARSVLDCAAALEVVWGYDHNDATSINNPSLEQSLTETVKQGQRVMQGLRVGVPREVVGGVEGNVRQTFTAALEEFESLGAIVEEVSLPLTEYTLAIYYIISQAEASANLARYDGLRFGPTESGADAREATEATRGKHFGDEVKRRIMLGTYALSAGYQDAWYKKALQARTLVTRDFAEVFAKVDVLATPTSPTVAFKLGEHTANPVAMYQSDACTVPANIAGIPGVSVPCGFTDGLPVGLQLLGPRLSDHTLLAVAHTYQCATDWHTQRPTMLGERLGRPEG